MPKLSPADFIAIVAPQAIEARRDGSPLFPSVRIAQNMLETGLNINNHYNLGGFKVGSGQTNEWWRGATYTTETWEVTGGRRVRTTASWRSYASIYDFYRDQDRLFRTDRYARVRAARTPDEQARALYESGYATDAPASVDGDPDYAEKLVSIMKQHDLYRFDYAEGEEPMTAEEKLAFQAAVEEIAAIRTKLDQATKEIPAPAWFVKEFGSGDLGGIIRDPRFTLEGWRVLAIGMRMNKGK